jgi:hypothetical protein
MLMEQCCLMTLVILLLVPATVFLVSEMSIMYAYLLDHICEESLHKLRKTGSFWNALLLINERRHVLVLVAKRYHKF